MPDNDLLQRGRARLAEIKAKCDEITRDGFSSQDGGLVVPDKAAAEFKSLIQESTKIREQIGLVSEAESLGRFLDAPANDSAGARQGQAAVTAQVPAQFKTLGQQFVESDEFKRRDGYHMRESFEVKSELGAWFLPQVEQSGAFEQKDLYTAAGGTYPTKLPLFGSVDRLPMIPDRMRTARVRDLFPSAQTTANLIQYVRSLGFLGGVNAAAPVPERSPDNTAFGLKPHSSITFAAAESAIRTIAHYEVAHRNVLDDEPQLRSIIDNELLYGLRLAEDAQLLNGDGTGENIMGLLNTPGIQEYPGTGFTPPGTDTYIDAIRRASTRIFLSYYEPTGIIVHPYDWEKIETTKDANGQYLAAVSVTTGAEQRLWRLPVVSTPVMPEGTALVGAFGLGAKIYDRMQSNIRVSDQHADFFIRNAVAILCESRLGLVVPRPESMVMVDLEAAAP